MPLNNLQSSLPSDSSAVIEFRKVNKWFGVKGEVPYPLSSETKRFLEMQVVPK